MLQNKKTSITSIDSYGKQKFLKEIQSKFKKHKADNYTVINNEHTSKVLASSLFLEGVHFNLAYFPIQHLGYKTIVATISKIIAQQTKPSHVGIQLALSNRFSVEAIDALTDGILHALNQYDIQLLDLDLTASTQGLVIAVNAYGDSGIKTSKKPQEKELIVVSGDLASAYFGLQVLERENEVFKVNPNTQPDLTPYDYVIQRQLRPQARVDVLDFLKNINITPSAMEIINNGISEAALNMVEKHNIGIQIYEEKLPIDQQAFKVAEELNMNVTTIALNGGEDYELLFTAPIEKAEEIRNHPHLTIIGYVNDTSAGSNLIGNGNQQIPLKRI